MASILTDEATLERGRTSRVCLESDVGDNVGLGDLSETVRGHHGPRHHPRLSDRRSNCAAVLLVVELPLSGVLQVEVCC